MQEECRHENGFRQKEPSKAERTMKAMKILLTALNAKYIHTNLAVRYLKQMAKQGRF